MFLVFDVSKESTFNCLESEALWYHPRTTICLIGNKADLTTVKMDYLLAYGYCHENCGYLNDDLIDLCAQYFIDKQNNRCIAAETAQELANQHDMDYFDISCQNGFEDVVDDMLQSITRRMIRQNRSRQAEIAKMRESRHCLVL